MNNSIKINATCHLYFTDIFEALFHVETLLYIEKKITLHSFMASEFLLYLYIVKMMNSLYQRVMK